MNFLAHCLIPDRAVEHTHPDLIAGGFVGDFLKGPVPDSLPRELALGIRLHRRIDAYSNRQAAIRTSCERFPVRLRRFAPIFVDVIADHLLARQWQHFHPGPLTAFTAQAYAAIEPHVSGLPEPGKRLFAHLREHDLLAGYRDRAVMHRVIGSIIRRLNRPQLHDGLEQIIDERLSELEGDFFAYFPDLLAHAREWLAEQQ